MTEDVVVTIAKFLKSLEGKKIPYNIIKHALIPLRRELIRTSSEATAILEREIRKGT